MLYSPYKTGARSSDALFVSLVTIKDHQRKTFGTRRKKAVSAAN
jgi:hypothetical protein